jgi:hypothetical protein
MPILQNFNQVTVRVINHPGQHSTKERRPQQKYVKRIDVPEKAKKKKKINQIQNRTKIKQIKDYGTSLSRPKQTSSAWAAVSHHAAENTTPCNPRPQMTDS